MQIKKPRALHFSGHGITVKEIQDEMRVLQRQCPGMYTDEEIEEVKNKGDALVLEDKKC
jgi:hypothetical protein